MECYIFEFSRISPGLSNLPKRLLESNQNTVMDSQIIDFRNDYMKLTFHILIKKTIVVICFKFN